MPAEPEQNDYNQDQEQPQEVPAYGENQEQPAYGETQQPQNEYGQQQDNYNTDESVAPEEPADLNPAETTFDQYSQNREDAPAGETYTETQQQSEETTFGSFEAQPEVPAELPQFNSESEMPAAPGAEETTYGSETQSFRPAELPQAEDLPLPGVAEEQAQLPGFGEQAQVPVFGEQAQVPVFGEQPQVPVFNQDQPILSQQFQPEQPLLQPGNEFVPSGNTQGNDLSAETLAGMSQSFG